MYTFKRTGNYQMNEETVTKYPKLCATVEPILLVFPSLYKVKSGFSYMHYFIIAIPAIQPKIPSLV